MINRAGCHYRHPAFFNVMRPGNTPDKKTEKSMENQCFQQDKKSLGKTKKMIDRRKRMWFNNICFEV